MEWYGKLPNIVKKAKAPAYIEERISDLNHASDLILTSPRDAKTVISAVISGLDAQHDSEYVPFLNEATRAILDSPSRAKQIIAKTVAAMLAERKRIEKELEEPSWKKKN